MLTDIIIQKKELSYRRGQNPQISPGDMAIGRQKQRLMTSSGGLCPSCTDFGPDQNTIYPGYFLQDMYRMGQ